MARSHWDLIRGSLELFTIDDTRLSAMRSILDLGLLINIDNIEILATLSGSAGQFFYSIPSTSNTEFTIEQSDLLAEIQTQGIQPNDHLLRHPEIWLAGEPSTGDSLDEGEGDDNANAGGSFGLSLCLLALLLAYFRRKY